MSLRVESSGEKTHTLLPMPAQIPTIVATSIGIPQRPRLPVPYAETAIYRLALELAEPRATPRMCFLATATGDAPESFLRAYTALAEMDVRLSHLALFPMPNFEDVRGHLLRKDVTWVGGGSVVNLLALWRAHALDRILHECWQAGVVLGGSRPGRCAGTWAARPTPSAWSCGR